MNPSTAMHVTTIKKESKGIQVWYSVYRLCYGEEEACELIDKGDEFQCFIYVKEGSAPYILIGSAIKDENGDRKVFRSMSDIEKEIKNHFLNNY